MFKTLIYVFYGFVMAFVFIIQLLVLSAMAGSYNAGLICTIILWMLFWDSKSYFRLEQVFRERVYKFFGLLYFTVFLAGMFGMVYQVPLYLLMGGSFLFASLIVKTNIVAGIDPDGDVLFRLEQTPRFKFKKG